MEGHQEHFTDALGYGRVRDYRIRNFHSITSGGGGAGEMSNYWSNEDIKQLSPFEPQACLENLEKMTLKKLAGVCTFHPRELMEKFKVAEITNDYGSGGEFDHMLIGWRCKICKRRAEPTQFELVEDL